MTRTQQEQSFLECLETQAQNSGQTHVERFSNFPAWAPRQHIARFLAAEHIYRQILEVPGVVIEGGVGLGAGLFTWAHLASILEPYNYSRKIVGFDLAERDEVWKDITELAYISDYNRPLGHIPRIELVAGPAQDTIPEYRLTHPGLLVAMLVLDFTTAEPTRVAMSNLVPLVPSGGVIVSGGIWPDELAHLSHAWPWRRCPWSSTLIWARKP